MAFAAAVSASPVGSSVDVASAAAAALLSRCFCSCLRRRFLFWVSLIVELVVDRAGEP
jgi:hypothetical protein